MDTRHRPASSNPRQIPGGLEVFCGPCQLGHKAARTGNAGKIPDPEAGFVPLLVSSGAWAGRCPNSTGSWEWVGNGIVLCPGAVSPSGMGSSPCPGAASPLAWGGVCLKAGWNSWSRCPEWDGQEWDWGVAVSTLRVTLGPPLPGDTAGGDKGHPWDSSPSSGRGLCLLTPT